MKKHCRNKSMCVYLSSLLSQADCILCNKLHYVCMCTSMFLIYSLTPAPHAEHISFTCSFFFLFFFGSACRSISAVLLWVTAAMAGAVCGQTLPVVVKAQTISRSTGPLSFCLSLSLCRLLCYTDREGEEGTGEERV